MGSGYGVLSSQLLMSGRLHLLDVCGTGAWCTIIAIHPKSFHTDDYETLLENVADPGHVPFAHKGVQGDPSRVKRGVFDLASNPNGSGSTLHGLAVTLPGFSGTQTLTYDPPCRLQYKFPLGKLAPGKHALFTIFATPVSPGVSRICISIRASAKPFLFSLISKKPRWFDHAFERCEGVGVCGRLC